MTIHSAQTLDGFADHAGCSDGVCFTSARNRNRPPRPARATRTIGWMMMEAPNKVLASGGALCPEPVEARLVGATSIGGIVKTGWIGVGLRLEMRLGRDRVTTSPVEDVAIGA